MKAVLIDPWARAVRKIDCPLAKDGEVDTGELAKIIGCRLVQMVQVARNITLWVDEEGLLKPDSEQRYFLYSHTFQPFAGRGIIFESEEKDITQITRSLVIFPEIERLGSYMVESKKGNFTVLTQVFDWKMKKPIELMQIMQGEIVYVVPLHLAKFLHMTNSLHTAIKSFIGEFGYEPKNNLVVLYSQTAWWMSDKVLPCGSREEAEALAEKALKAAVEGINSIFN